MAEMTMIEGCDGTITWECSACEAILQDKKNFEDKTKKCPKCGSDITTFNSLFDEDVDVHPA
jgi:NAD-dependent SIR2 family protein deacetylase